jgi:carbonic anhydrase/acetyltransferase-like protein (isoleucine patch superfamily)
MPCATPTKKASFIDPSVTIKNGSTTVISFQSYVAPYVTLDSRGHAAIKIGAGSDVLDSAQIIANPGHAYLTPQLLVGNNVSIGPWAEVLGPSVIGSYSQTAAPTGIGARAIIDDATIEPGAIVSPLARVGPGVTVPSGYRVLPGVNVTDDAEASDPKLGMVVPVTSSDLSALKLTIADAVGLAAGYTNLYQGTSSFGTNIGASPKVSGVNNGYLPNVEGVSPSPGPTYVAGTKSASPEFPTPHKGLDSAVVYSYNFAGRMIGAVTFTTQRPTRLLHYLGRANSIRADVGQPFTIASIAHTGLHVTITAPAGGSLTIGSGFRAGSDAVILGEPGAKATIGDLVSIGPGAVVDGSSLGSGSTVGANAYLLNSTFPANIQIPAGAIYVNNRFQGYVQS